jgi:hypothetical protein
MNNLTKALLGGVSLSALAVVSAAAQQKHPFAITALHAGRVVNKTRPAFHCLGTLTYCSFYIFTYVSTANLNKTVNLMNTFYKFNSNNSFCSNPHKPHIKVQKNKTVYGKVGTATITYYEGCKGAQPKFYGDTYELTDASGKSDYFESMLTGKFHLGGSEYRGRLILDVRVEIKAE